MKVFSVPCKWVLIHVGTGCKPVAPQPGTSSAAGVNKTKTTRPMSNNRVTMKSEKPASKPVYSSVSVGTKKMAKPPPMPHIPGKRKNENVKKNFSETCRPPYLMRNFLPSPTNFVSC